MSGASFLPNGHHAVAPHGHHACSFSFFCEILDGPIPAVDDVLSPMDSPTLAGGGGLVQGGATLEVGSTPATPASVSSSFRRACEQIPEVDTPRESCARPESCQHGREKAYARSRRPSTRGGGAGKKTQPFPDMFLRRSQLRAASASTGQHAQGAANRFSEHGAAVQSTVRSVSSCSFGRAKRQICEHDVKEKAESIPQEVIRHDKDPHAVEHLPKQAGSMSRAERFGRPAERFGRLADSSEPGHWSQRKERQHDKWSKRVQYGHHSPPGSAHERDMIFNRTAYGNQTMHDFFV